MAKPPFQKPFVIGPDGLHEQLTTGALINAGGTICNSFTVGGRGLLFDDGSSTSGDPSKPIGGTLQIAYNNSVNDTQYGGATIVLDDLKPLIITDLAGSTSISFSSAGQFTVDASSTFLNDVVINGNLSTTGLINGFSLSEINDTLQQHMAGEIGFRHTASDVDILSIQNLPGVATAQTALEVLANRTAAMVKSYVHIQSSSSIYWFIEHNTGSPHVIVNCYDSDGAQFIPHQIETLNNNTALVTLSTKQTGKALVLCL